jgi:acyl-CoA synthetase (AMP-forming)/AMP-acid ligase II
MVDSVIDHKISSCIFTPTQAKMLLNAPNKSRLLEWADMHAFVLGGETIPPWFVRDFYRLNLPHAKLFNGYAPSETTVVNTLRQ